MLERRDLGEAGRTYIRERLAGGRTLSHLLLTGLDLAAGHVWAFLPSTMSDEQATRVAEAGITRLVTQAAPERTLRADGEWEAVENHVEPLIAAHVCRFLAEDENAIGAWEDPNLESEDGWVRDHPEEPLVFLDQEVYYILRHRTVTSEAVATGLHTMGAWWGSPAVLASPPPEALRPFETRHHAITSQDLHSLVEHCQMVCFLAYDQEGFVVWNP